LNLRKLVADNPDITVETIVDYGLTDIVAERFEAGVRLCEHFAKDMIAVRISPQIPTAIVGSPKYVRRHAVPTAPAFKLLVEALRYRPPASH
jgi:hypothetical protein